MIYAIEINPINFAPARINNLATILNIILPLLQIGGALLFLIMLLRASFIWLTAGDKPDNISKAKKMMFFAVIGLFIIVFSFIFVKVIGYILNINMPI